MVSIDLMVEEHRQIKNMLNVMRSACYQLITNQIFVQEDFKLMIEFVRQYADAHHHGKEEQLFFNRMVDELGPAAEKIVTHGMLVEHDLGRLFIQNLEESILRFSEGHKSSKLDIVAHAIGYTHLLQRHIDKEDRVVYPFAEKNFSQESLQSIEDAFIQHEQSATTSQHYLNILNQLQTKYPTIVE